MRKKCSYNRKFNKQGESYIEFDNVSSLIIQYDKNTKLWYVKFKIYRKSWLSILWHFSFYVWVYLRNIAALAIRISLYICASILIILLIYNGIQIVRHSYDNPEEEVNFLF